MVQKFAGFSLEGDQLALCSWSTIDFVQAFEFWVCVKFSFLRRDRELMGFHCYGKQIDNSMKWNGGDEVEF